MSGQPLKKYSLKNDVMFKELFSKKGNEAFLKEFLEELLKIKIQNIDIEKDCSLGRFEVDEKLGVLDIKATLNDNTIINIEMQMSQYYHMTQRVTFYSSRLISTQLEAGQMYKDIKPVVIILLLNYNMFKFEDYITETITVAKKHREYEINDYQKYYYIELPKFRKIKEKDNTKLTEWLTFIDGEEKERINDIMEKNDLIKQANDELEYLNGDEEKRRIAELREKALKDNASLLDDAYEKGKKNQTLEIAKNMLKKKIDINIIIEVTNLSIAEIENLIDNK